MVVGIIDGQTVQGVAIAKNLREARIKTILFCSERLSYGYNSKYSHKSILSPSSKNIEKFHNFFIDYLSRQSLDFIIACNDDSAIYIAQKKHILEKLVRILSPTIESFNKGFNKNLLMNLCKKNGIPHPKTIDLNHIKMKKELIDIDYPAILKPNALSGARGFLEVKNKEELLNGLELISKQKNGYHIQELLPASGRQLKVQILRINKKIIAKSVIEKIRFYPRKGGSSCFNRTSNGFNESIDNCTRVLEILDWEGFADFDLIEDIRNGEFKIIEINPRFPACIKSVFLSGIDYPLLIIEKLFNQRLKAGTKIKKIVYLRFITLDLLWLLNKKTTLKDLICFFKSFTYKNHFYQDLDFNDFKSFFYGTLGNLKQLINGKKQKKIKIENTNI